MSIPFRAPGEWGFKKRG
uniref:Uncharacterized protein n=1 Tax=Anguilla anguilla TaxID=7936 RepID=A0A0E9RWD1_ANGAN